MCRSCRPGLLFVALVLHLAPFGWGQTPRGAGPARFDLAGEPLPERAIARLGTNRFRHGIRIGSMSMSSDGKYLAVLGASSLRILNTADGRSVQHFGTEFSNSFGGIAAVTFAPDGKSVFVVDNGIPRLLDVATGKLVWNIPARFGSVMGLAYAGDGKTIAIQSRGQALALVDVTTRESSQIRKIAARPGRDSSGIGPIDYLAFSPDSRLLASANSHEVELWDVATRQRLKVLTGHTGPVYAIAFSHQGTILASAGDDKIIRLWDVTSGKLLRQLNGHKDKISSLVFAPDDRTLVSSSGVYSLEVDAADKRLRHWDVATGKELGHFEVEGDEVAAAAMSPDGKRLYAVVYSALRVWDVATRKPIVGQEGHGDAIVGLVFSPDGGSVVSGGDEDHELRLWDVATARSRWVESRHQQGVSSVSFTPGGRVVNVGYRRGVVSWIDAASGEELRHVKAQLPVSSFACSPDNKLLALSFDTRLELWDAETGKKLREMDAGPERMYHLAFSPDGKLLATTGTIIAPGKPVDKEQVPVRLWDVATGKQLRVLGEHPGNFVSSLSFTPDGTCVVSTNRKGTHFWKVSSGRAFQIEVSERAHSLVNHHVLSPDGRTLAIDGPGGAVRLWEVATRRTRQAFSGHHGQVTALAFSPDGRMLASGSWDTTILLWDATGALSQRGKIVTDDDLDAAWSKLAGEDAPAAFQVLGTFLAAPEKAMALLKARLHPAAVNSTKPVSVLIADLDSPKFAVRAAAQKELEHLGASVEPALRQALVQKPSLEVRQRLELLLEKSDTLPADVRQGIRAVEVLEYLGTPEARDLLRTVAGGTPGARLTVEAQGSIDRLARRPIQKP